MKIKINSLESYNIEFPEELSFQEFQGFLIRANKIDKIFSKTNEISETEQPKSKHNIKGTKHVKLGFWKDEANIQKIISLHKEGKSADEIALAFGISKMSIYNRIYILKKEGRLQ